MSVAGFRHGLIFPAAPALASWEPDGSIEIVDFVSGLTARAEGVFEQEASDLLRHGVRGRALRTLGADHPLALALDRLVGQQSLPLSPSTALELDRFDTLFLELTGACTSRCIHCYARADAGVSTRLDRRTCEAVIEQAVQLGFRWIQLTGGEPLLCEFLEELVRHAHLVGAPCCEIYTNGTLLDDRRLEALAGLGVRFAFSFYSYRKEVHEAITRTPQSHRLTTEAIRRVVRLGLQARVSIVVMHENADHVAETMDYLRDLGLTDVGFGPSYAVGRGVLYAEQIRAPVGGEDRGYCREPHGKLCVSHDGTVYPCIFNRETPLGRVPGQSLRQIVASPDLPRTMHQPRDAFLARCGQRLSCPECRLTAYALNVLQEG